VPTVNAQVSQFLAANHNSAPSSGLYTVWIGANDLFSIINGSGVTPTAAAQSGADAITALAQAGAKTVIVNAHRYLLDHGGDVSFWESGWLRDQIRYWQDGDPGPS